MPSDLSSELNKIQDLPGLHRFLSGLKPVEGKFGGRKYTKDGSTGGVTLNAITKQFEKIARCHNQQSEERPEEEAARLGTTKAIACKILELGASSITHSGRQYHTRVAQEGRMSTIRRIFENLIYNRGKVLSQLMSNGALSRVIFITHKHLGGYQDDGAQALIYLICKKAEEESRETSEVDYELVGMADEFLRQSSARKKGKLVETFYDRRGSSRERSLLMMAKELFETNNHKLQALADMLVVRAASLTHPQGIAWVSGTGLPKRYEKLLGGIPHFLKKNTRNNRSNVY